MISYDDSGYVMNGKTDDKSISRMPNHQLLSTLLDYKLTYRQRETFTQLLEFIRADPKRTISAHQRMWAEMTLEGARRHGRLLPPPILPPLSLPKQPPTRGAR